MKKIFFLTISIFLSLNFPNISTCETLTIGVDTWKPWQMHENENFSGITLDIVNELSKRTNLKTSFKMLPYKRLMLAFEKQEIDVELSVNPAWREEQKDISVYTTPFYKTGDIIIVRTENAFKINSVTDFKGMKIGCGFGYYYPEGFQEAFEKGEILRDDNTVLENNLKKLATNRIDGAIFDKLQFMYFIKILSMSADNFKIVYEFKPSELSLRIHKSKQNLLPILNPAIESMKTDGTITLIVAKYIE